MKNKKELLEMFEGFYNNEHPQIPQYIKYLAKNLADPDLINKVVVEFPIYKKSHHFWNNKFWNRKIIDFLTQLNTRNFDALAKCYFKQNKCYNKQLLQYSFEKNADKTIEILIENNALNEPTHLRSLICADQFELIFSKFPQDLINGLRTTQLFLEPKVWEKIKNVLSIWKGERFDYYLTFKDLIDTDKLYKEQINNKSHLFENPFKLFFHLSLWHEKINYHNQKEKSGDIEIDPTLIAVYNYSIGECKHADLDQNILELASLQKEVFNCEKEQKEYQELFLLLYKYLDFKSNVLEFFCFDKNACPGRDEEGNLLLKVQNDQKEKLWIRNGLKYQAWHLYYLQKSATHYQSDMVNNLSFARSLYKDEKQFDLQSEFHASQYRNKYFFKDLNLSTHKLKCGTALFNVVNNLEALRSNVMIKELRPKEILMGMCRDFKMYRDKLKQFSLDNNFIRLENYDDLVKKCMNFTKIDKDEAQSILDFQVTNLTNCNSKEKKVDLKPIIRIGNICLILPWLFKMLTPAISIINELVTNTELKSRYGSVIEEQVIREFYKSNYSVDGFDQINKKGDYDCLAYKDGVLFVIQTKATHIRASLKDNFLFTEREINKAKHQIDKNLVDLHANFKSIRDRLGIKEVSIDKLQIFPLIVTTSFEKDGETLVSSFDPKYKIHKISLFELQIILRGEEQNMFDYNEVFFNQTVQYKQGKRRCSAQEFIAMIQTNQVWAKIDASPISINEKYYTISNSTANQLCDESIRELGKGNVDNALLLISEAIKQNSSNAKFYCHLGDINSELGQLDFAIECYTKSIKLNPEFVDAYYNLSQIYLKQNNLFPAYACITKVLELDPSDNDARVNLNAIESDILKQPDLMNKIKEFLTQ
ncbi:tetratricopeptide repeat protein [Marinifilum fragile]|uniref:tetratricopeptide repeat protein n=1 Tax=Marinifilum fragile TaxID=570161 RepID=UPI002AA740D3|nr:tetratricopeptide repeat protein [Marinifilum fragile]